MKSPPPSMCTRVECDIFFNRSSNQRSGIILEVQIRNFGARTVERTSKFSFKNILVGMFENAVKKVFLAVFGG